MPSAGLCVHLRAISPDAYVTDSMCSAAAGTKALLSRGCVANAVRSCRIACRYAHSLREQALFKELARSSLCESSCASFCRAAFSLLRLLLRAGRLVLVLCVCTWFNCVWCGSVCRMVAFPACGAPLELKKWPRRQF